MYLVKFCLQGMLRWPQVPEVWVPWKISEGDFFADAAQPQRQNPPAPAKKLVRVKAAVLTLRCCVFCSGRVGGFTFGCLSARLPGNFTSKHLAQSSFGVVWLTLLWASAVRTRKPGVCGAGMKGKGKSYTNLSHTINSGDSDLMAEVYNIMWARCIGRGKKQRVATSYWLIKKIWWSAWDGEWNSWAWASWLIQYDKQPFLTQEIRQEGQVIQR